MARRSPAPFDAEPIALPTFTAAVGPWTATDPAQELTSFSTVRITLNFDDGDSIQFDASAESPEALYLDELASDVWVRGPIEQRFRVTSIDQEWDPNGGSKLTVTALSYKRLFNARLIGVGGLSFAAGTDQGEIVWGLVNHSQGRTNGSLGITKGTVTTGVTRERTYVEGDNIGDQLGKLQDVIDGPWWDVDFDRVLTVAMPSTFPTLETPLAIGVSARSLQRRSVAAQFANVIYADGNKQETTPVWREHPDLATDPRGRWEAARGFPTTELQQTLIESAEGAVLDAHSPAAVWAAVVEPRRWLNDFQVMPGDRVVVTVPSTSATATAGEAQARTHEVGISLTADSAIDVQATFVEIGDDS